MWCYIHIVIYHYLGKILITIFSHIARPQCGKYHAFKYRCRFWAWNVSVPHDGSSSSCSHYPNTAWKLISSEWRSAPPRLCLQRVCGGGWAAALAEPWANCRMFTLRRGTGLIITARPGHIKGLQKGQTFWWSATVSRLARVHANTYTKGRPHTHSSTHQASIPPQRTWLLTVAPSLALNLLRHTKSQQYLRWHQSRRIMSFLTTGSTNTHKHSYLVYLDRVDVSNCVNIWVIQPLAA